MRKISPAVAISLTALFFSLTGAGFAASRYIITSRSQIAPSVLRSLQGHPGPQGPAGPQGAPGPQGPAGAIGPQGLAGSNARTVIPYGDVVIADCANGTIIVVDPTTVTDPAILAVLQGRPISPELAAKLCGPTQN